MEEIFKTIDKQEKEGVPVITGEEMHNVQPISDMTGSFPGISFAPQQEATLSSFPSFDVREKCAFAGLVFGCISIISWTVIALGVAVSAVGIIFSLLGKESSRSKLARTGLLLSIIGGIATIVYVALISAGIINYNYFTNEFWGIPSGGVQVIE